MLSHTVSYTITVDVRPFIDQGITQEEIQEELFEKFSTNCGPSDKDGHVEFQTDNEWYQSRLDDMENILNTMVFNKRNPKKVECPHCGSDVTELLHGYCMDCSKEKQLMLNHILDEYKHNE